MEKLVGAIFISAIFLYPIWAIPASVILATFLAKGMVHERFWLRWLTVSLIEIVLFLPVVIGRDFVLGLAPWYVAVVMPGKTSVDMRLLLGTLAFLVLISYRAVRPGRKDSD